MIRVRMLMTVLALAALVACATVPPQVAEEKFSPVNYGCPECNYDQDRADCEYSVDRDCPDTQPAISGSLIFALVASQDTKEKRARMFRNCMITKGWTMEPITAPENK